MLFWELLELYLIALEAYLIEILGLLLLFTWLRQPKDNAKVPSLARAGRQASAFGRRSRH
jgi:hypothetical protein